MLTTHKGGGGCGLGLTRNTNVALSLVCLVVCNVTTSQQNFIFVCTLLASRNSWKDRICVKSCRKCSRKKKIIYRGHLKSAETGPGTSGYVKRALAGSDGACVRVGEIGETGDRLGAGLRRELRVEVCCGGCDV